MTRVMEKRACDVCVREGQTVRVWGERGSQSSTCTGQNVIRYLKNVYAHALFFFIKKKPHKSKTNY